MARPKVEEDEDDVAFNEGVDRQAVLNRLDLMTEAELASIYGCGIKRIRNRPRSELPPYFRLGGKRLWFREHVVKFFKDLTG